MLSRFLSRSRRAAAPKHTAPKSPAFRLGLEALETREVPAILLGLDNANNLVRFDSAATATITTTAITGFATATNERVVGIDFRPRTGQLYGLTVDNNGTGTNARLYTINTQTGAATQVGTTPVTVPADTTANYGFDFNPVVDRIRVVHSQDANYRLNPNNGALVTTLPTDLPLNPAGGDIDGVAYDRNYDFPSATTLYGITNGTNGTNGALVTIGGLNGTPSPNLGTVTTVGTTLGVNIDAGSFVGFDIATPATTGGLSSVYAVFDGDNTGPVATGLYRINLSTGTATLVGLVGDGTMRLTGLAVVPEGTVVVGSGLGASGDVRLLDPTSGTVRAQIVPFSDYKGGVRVAAGDVTRDGIPDAIVTATIPGGHVKVFNGATGAQLGGTIGSFLPFAGFQGTVNVASGDVNGDGTADVIVVANNANGHVKVFNGVDGTELASFLAYQGFLGNVTVAVADFNNDGFDEIVTAASINGHVKVFNGGYATGTTGGTLFAAAALPNFVNSFFAYPGFTSGPIAVAAGDVNGDGVADIVTVSGTNSNGHVKAFNGKGSTSAASAPDLLANFLSSPTALLTDSPSVGLADANNDGVVDIRLTPGVGPQADVTTYGLDGKTLGTKFAAFASFVGGATIGGARV